MRHQKLIGTWAKLFRVKSIPQSVFLVAIGAATGWNRHQQPLHALARLPQLPPAAKQELLAASAATAMTASQSMLINDYQDYKLGRDRKKPNKPIVAQEVGMPALRSAILVGYVAITLATERIKTGDIVRLTNLLLFLYTRWIKPITGLKNVFCAGIVSMAVGTGSVAIGGSVQSVWRPMFAVFGTIWHREILMDVCDIEDDRASQVRTLPIVMGARNAIAFSLIPLSFPIFTSCTSLAFALSTTQFVCAALQLLASCDDSQLIKTNVVETLPYTLLLFLLFIGG